MQPASNALLALEKALPLDTLRSTEQSGKRSRGKLPARLPRHDKEAVVVFMLKFSSVVNVAGLSLGLPARGTQMIQPTTENKYCFIMQVSARTMGGRDRSLPQPDNSAARSIFKIFDR